jgi:hypothetical protein
MKKRNKGGWGRLTARVAIVLTSMAAFTASGQSTNPPALSISLTNQLGTNYLSLTVTNHVGGRLYELYYSYEIATPQKQWIGPYVTGQTNQTNFVILQPEAPIVFLVARDGSDTDGDGVPNARDADPFDFNIGELQVIIYSPANGSNIQ